MGIYFHNSCRCGENIRLWNAEFSWVQCCLINSVIASDKLSCLVFNLSASGVDAIYVIIHQGILLKTVSILGSQSHAYNYKQVLLKETCILK